MTQQSDLDFIRETARESKRLLREQSHRLQSIEGKPLTMHCSKCDKTFELMAILSSNVPGCV